MARWFGDVGFVETVDIGYGVWEPRTITRKYFGDILSNSRRWSQKQDSTNDDLALNNQISIVCDSFAMENLAAIKWAEFMGARWKVTNVSVEYPRLVLSLGEIYNEDVPFAEGGGVGA